MSLAFFMNLLKTSTSSIVCESLLTAAIMSSDWSKLFEMVARCDAVVGAFVLAEELNDCAMSSSRRQLLLIVDALRHRSEDFQPRQLRCLLRDPELELHRILGAAFRSLYIRVIHFSGGDFAALSLEAAGGWVLEGTHENSFLAVGARIRRACRLPKEQARHAGGAKINQVQLQI
jgi:hypothetical protein